ncbi:unnamed protein product [Trifolium pratense]|uniref:Uncharacterized protein n=1 Tax=Trifolium pratense TaxID=57577 RepID=A0ACB0LCS8_TRIPR|nr:unnamed protein product [Trifolium pratense]
MNKMLRSLFLVLLLIHATLATQKLSLSSLSTSSRISSPTKIWSTLSGSKPVVVARGGFTGLFPEGSTEAIGISKEISIFLCNLQFTKDAGAFCVTGIKLDNATNIATFDPKLKTYKINGKDVQGHFMVDYTGAQIDHNVTMALYFPPTTKQPYGSIVKDLAAIKSYALGIMVPKEYICPIKPDKYMGTPTTLVYDAHKQGLEVYASGFANDLFSSYSYNYDPTAEYLQFIEKEEIVDGLVTDFPSTASNPIEPVFIISNNGASGVYPGSTDLAYQKAIDDGVDIIDCSVQMTKDGILFCLNTVDLMADTTAMTKFMSRTSNIPEIQPKTGIFSFDLTWNEIQTLQRNTFI